MNTEEVLLPDGIHKITSVILGEWRLCAIVHTLTYRETHRMRLPMTPEGEDLWIGYQEKAKAAFPVPLRHKSRVS